MGPVFYFHKNGSINLVREQLSRLPIVMEMHKLAAGRTEIDLKVAASAVLHQNNFLFPAPVKPLGITESVQVDQLLAASCHPKILAPACKEDIANGLVVARGVSLQVCR